MKKIHVNFTIDEYADISELRKDDQVLIDYAKKVIPNAYAPYSTFKVAAAARLKNGKIVTGTNQENASTPAGICAERTLLSAISSLYPTESIDTIAITYLKNKAKSNYPVAPCGICRQSLLEYEIRMNAPIRIILTGKEGKVVIVHSVKDLLPLYFSANDLSNKMI